MWEKGSMLYNIAEILLIIGGLNWLLFVFGLNLVALLPVAWLQTVVYVLVGASAIVLGIIKLRDM